MFVSPPSLSVCASEFFFPQNNKISLSLYPSPLPLNKPPLWRIFPGFSSLFSLKIDIHGTQKPIRFCCLLPPSKNGNESRKMQFSWEAVTFWPPAANLPLPPSPSPAFKYCPICTCLFDCLPPPLPPPQSYHIFIKKKRIPYISSNGSKDDWKRLLVHSEPGPGPKGRLELP